MLFSETQEGKAFFQSQLPQLIGVLSDISQALKRPALVYQLPQDVPPDFFTKLYNGGYIPSEETVGEEYRSRTKEIIARQEELRKKLPDELWEELECLQDAIAVRGSVAQEQAFAAGFRYATMMFAAGLSTPGQDKKGGEGDA